MGNGKEGKSRYFFILNKKYAQNVCLIGGRVSVLIHHVRFLLNIHLNSQITSISVKTVTHNTSFNYLFTATRFGSNCGPSSGLL